MIPHCICQHGPHTSDGQEDCDICYCPDYEPWLEGDQPIEYERRPVQ